MMSYPPGTAPIKGEFLVHRSEPSFYDDDGAEESKRPPIGRISEGGATQTRKQKKAQRGQNKGRKFGKVRDELELCWKVGNGVLCEFGEGYVFLSRFSFSLSNLCHFSCRFTHDIISRQNHQTFTSLLSKKLLAPAHLHKSLSARAIRFILPLMFPQFALFSQRQVNVGTFCVPPESYRPAYRMIDMV